MRASAEHCGIALRWGHLRKGQGQIMRKQYIRWILPIVALLIIATAVALEPALVSHVFTAGYRGM